MNVLLICYKIEAGKGSEDGSGYHIAKELVRSGLKTTIISRSNNISLLSTNPEFAGVKFVPVDVPRALSFYKKRDRGIIIYYYLWQIFVGFKVWNLQKEKAYNVIHLLN